MLLRFQVDDLIYSITIPLSPEEISFSDFCDFRKLESAYIDANTSEDRKSDKPLLLLMDALSTIVKGDLSKIPVAIDGDDYESFYDKGFILKPGDDITVLRIYFHILTVINKYVPEEIPQTFTVKRSVFPWIKDPEYIVRSESAARVLANRPFTTGEMLEVLEYQRLSEHSVRVGGDPANVEFTLGLAEVSILLRKPGEDLPTSRRKLKQFIRERSEIFGNLPLSVILDLRFFLIAALLKLRTTVGLDSFGKARRVQTIPENRRNRKSARRRRRKHGR